jgi:hypothetical protein
MSAEKGLPEGSFQFVLRTYREYDATIARAASTYGEAVNSRDVIHPDGIRRPTIFLATEAARDRLTKLGWEDVSSLWTSEIAKRNPKPATVVETNAKDETSPKVTPALRSSPSPTPSLGSPPPSAASPPDNNSVASIAATGHRVSKAGFLQRALQAIRLDPPKATPVVSTSLGDLPNESQAFGTPVSLIVSDASPPSGPTLDEQPGEDDEEILNANKNQSASPTPPAEPSAQPTAQTAAAPNSAPTKNDKPKPKPAPKPSSKTAKA